MSDLLEADDAYTGGEHSHGVVALALAVGDALGLGRATGATWSSPRCCTTSARSACPTRSSTSPASSPTTEFEIVKRHPVDGQEMLERVGGVLSEVGIIVRHHHERWDGRGYPDRIAGEAIPLAARIICACDAYSAMTTNRAYRAALAASPRRWPSSSAARATSSIRTWSSRCCETVARHPEHRPARALLELAA